jgi:hypothetical protein
MPFSGSNIELFSMKGKTRLYGVKPLQYFQMAELARFQYRVPCQAMASLQKPDDHFHVASLGGSYAHAFRGVVVHVARASKRVQPLHNL